MALDYQTQSVPKHLMWGAFTICEGLAMAPLITMASMPILFNALAATAVMVGGLSAYAYMTPTQDFLSMQTGLMVGLCGLLGVSLVNIFWPSPLLMNLALYGGLLLFGGFVLYDTQKILASAETVERFDPLGMSIGMYLDAIIIF
jgi:FtsH-binding integral membrane protein